MSVRSVVRTSVFFAAAVLLVMSPAFGATYSVDCSLQGPDRQVIQDAIDSAELDGGGIVQLSAGDCEIDGTLNVNGDANGNAVMIRGAMRAVLTVTVTVSYDGATRLVWTGTSQGDMIVFEPPDTGCSPSPATLHGGGVEDLFIEAKGAGRALVLRSVNGASFRGLAIRSPVLVGIEVGIASWAGNCSGTFDSQLNTFEGISVRAFHEDRSADNGHGIVLGKDNDSAADNGNTSLNYFNNIYVFHYHGDGLRLEDADGNYFGTVVTKRLPSGNPPATGVGIRLMGVGPSGGTGAIDNTFVSVQAPGGGLVAELSSVAYTPGTGQKYPHSRNRILDYSRNNGAPEPIIEEAGDSGRAILHWQNGGEVWGALVRLDQNQAIDDTWTAERLIWGNPYPQPDTDRGDYDRAGWKSGNKFWDSAQPTRLTIPEERGICRVEVSAGIQWWVLDSQDPHFGKTDSQRFVEILKNGTSAPGLAVSRTHNLMLNTHQEIGLTSASVDVKGGDYFEINLLRRDTVPGVGTTSLDVHRGRTWFAIRVINNSCSPEDQGLPIVQYSP